MFNAAKFGLRQLLECRAVTLPIGERKTWRTQSNFAPGKIPLRGNSRRKCTYSLPAQVTAKHRAKFSWLPLSSDEVKTRKPLKLSGVPQYIYPNILYPILYPNRCQPLVGRSSPYYEDMWRTYCCLTIFFPIVDTCLSCEDIARQSCAMVPRWRFFGDFLRPAFPASRVPQVSDLHLKFALRPHRVWKYGRHPICNGFD